MSSMKICRKCETSKPTSEFSRRSKESRDKLHPWCNVCKRGYERQYRKNNPGKMRDKQRRYVARERQMHAESLAAVRAMRG